jgi:ankyrin repeat protein
MKCSTLTSYSQYFGNTDAAFVRQRQAELGAYIGALLKALASLESTGRAAATCYARLDQLLELNSHGIVAPVPAPTVAPRALFREAMDAVRKHSAEALRNCEARGLDLGKSTGSLSETLLHHAAAVGDAEIIRLLLEKGCDVDAVDRDGDTPLHSAVATGQADALSVLLEAKANPRAVNKMKATPLHYAAAASQIACMQVLLRAHPDILELPDGAQRTVLHESAWQGSVEGVQLLLSSGANVLAEDHLGRTPVHIACDRQQPEVLRLLLSKSATITCVSVLYTFTCISFCVASACIIMIVVIVTHHHTSTRMHAS